MTDLAKNAEDYVNGKRTQWANLVKIAVGIRESQLDRAAARLAVRAGESETTVKHKMRAVRYAMNTSTKTRDFCTQEEIAAKIKELISQGQKAVIASYIQGKTKARTNPLVAFPHRLTPAVRDDLKELCLRLGRVLGLKTYDEVFEFILSQFAIATDQELLHAAGTNGTVPTAMTAPQLKSHLLTWARFKQRWAIATLECEWSPGVSYNLADVMGIDDKGRVVEVEVKVTMADLRNDLEKKEKHSCLRTTFDAKTPLLAEGSLVGFAHVDRFNKRIPARFYYAVPAILRYEAKDFVEQNVPYAGLLSDAGGWHLIETVRRAPVLHSTVTGLEEQWHIVKSQTSQFARSYRRLIEMNSQFVLKPSKDEGDGNTEN